MHVVGLQALDGDERQLLLNLAGTAVRAGRLLLGSPDQQLEVFPAGRAMEIEERHDDAVLIGRTRSAANPKDPAGIRLEPVGRPA